MIAPCKDCERRHFKCHSECEDYKKYRAWCDERHKKRRENSEFICYVSQRQAKREKSKRRGKDFRRKR